MGADVRSIDELREYHASLTTYRATLLEALSSVQMEIRRAFDWIEETAAIWQRRGREAEEEVVQCQAELAQRKFPMWDGRIPDCSVQEEALRRAKARREFCEEQVRVCKRWLARLPKMVEETYEGPARRLLNALEIDLPNGLSLLSRRIGALEAYADLRPDHAPPPSTVLLPHARPPAEPMPTPTDANSPQPDANTESAGSGDFRSAGSGDFRSAGSGDFRSAGSGDFANDSTNDSPKPPGPDPS